MLLWGMTPLALLAGWRTHVHARRRREQGTGGGQGVILYLTALLTLKLQSTG
jgi:hypothetical protein